MAEKVIVITGASEGIGAALARLVGTQGNKVVLAARNEDKLRAVAAEIGPNALTLVTDVTRRSDMERLRDAALQKFGQVDVWVNNAGRGNNTPALELTDAILDEMLLVNCKSVLYGMQAILPHFMERGKGDIINISSFLSRIPFATYRAAYSAAKAAMNVLSTCIRMDLAGRYPDIHISVVFPGVVKTEFFEHALGGTPNVQGMLASPGAKTPEEVAEVIADVMEHPRPEVYVNPESAETLKKYLEDAGAFEANMRRRG